MSDQALPTKEELVEAIVDSCGEVSIHATPGSDVSETLIKTAEKLMNHVAKTPEFRSKLKVEVERLLEEERERIIFGLYGSQVLKKIDWEPVGGWPDDDES